MTNNNVTMIVSVGFKIHFFKPPLTNIKKPPRGWAKGGGGEVDT